MFGLYHLLGIEDEQAKFKQEVTAFFSGAASWLVHAHGAQIVHEAITLAVPVIKSLMTASLSNQEKHATVVEAIKTGMGDAVSGFSENDFADIISSGLSNVRHEQETLAAK
jgi:hypothetical protein